MGVLFRNFVGQNRPTLNLSEVATGETWFGTDAVKMGLCDEIKAVDDVLMEYIDEGWEVYEVEYTPPDELGLASPLALPGGNNSKGRGRLSNGIRWLVRTLASEIRSELSNEGLLQDNNFAVEKRYMAKDDQSDRVKF